MKNLVSNLKELGNRISKRIDEFLFKSLKQDLTDMVQSMLFNTEELETILKSSPFNTRKFNCIDNLVFAIHEVIRIVSIKDYNIDENKVRISFVKD